LKNKELDCPEKAKHLKSPELILERIEAEAILKQHLGDDFGQTRLLDVER
jgi:hypothetical protein